VRDPHWTRVYDSEAQAAENLRRLVQRERFVTDWLRRSAMVDGRRLALFLMRGT
jgi:hypothetical protein